MTDTAGFSRMCQTDTCVLQIQNLCLKFESECGSLYQIDLRQNYYTTNMSYFLQSRISKSKLDSYTTFLYCLDCSIWLAHAALVVDARSIVVRCEILLLLQIKKVKLLWENGKMLLSAGFKASI